MTPWVTGGTSSVGPGGFTRSLPTICRGWFARTSNLRTGESFHCRGGPVQRPPVWRTVRTSLDREWRWLISGSDHFESRQLSSSQLFALEPDDLRSFHQAYWLPSQLVVAISGDVSTPEVLEKLEALLGDWKGRSMRQRPSPWTPRRPAKPGLYHLEVESPQVKVALGHLGSKQRSWDDPESWALILMREVLGGDGTISRLSRRLRAEDHLVYRVRSHFGIGQHLVGEFQIFFECEGSSVAPAVRRILDAMCRLRREPVPTVELALAKHALIDAFPLLFDSAEKIAGRFAEDVLLGRPHSYWQQYRERIAAVRSPEVQRVARRYLKPAKVRLLAVGPWSTTAVGKGGTRLETLVQGKVIHLPQRDPLTLEPLLP